MGKAVKKLQDTVEHQSTAIRQLRAEQQNVNFLTSTQTQTLSSLKWLSISTHSGESFLCKEAGQIYSFVGVELVVVQTNHCHSYSPLANHVSSAESG
jgi:hypothetical protein